MHYLSIAGISLLPVLLGSLCYWLYFIPDLGAFLFRLIPVIMIVIWYQAGKWIAGRVRRPAAAYFGCHPCLNTGTVRMETSDLLNLFLPYVGHRATIVDLPETV